MGETLSVGQTSLASQLEMLLTYIWDGSVSFGIEQVNALENEKQFELEALKGQYLLTVSDDQASMAGEAIFSITGLAADKMTVDKASARLATRGIDVDGYESFMTMCTQNMSAFLVNMANLDQDPDQAKALMNRQMAAMGFRMMAAYERLLKAGLELQVSDLMVNLADGDITGDVTLWNRS